jgi:ABC-type transporter Mla subunit MlaD
MGGSGQAAPRPDDEEGTMTDRENQAAEEAAEAARQAASDAKDAATETVSEMKAAAADAAARGAEAVKETADAAKQAAQSASEQADDAKAGAADAAEQAAAAKAAAADAIDTAKQVAAEAAAKLAGSVKSATSQLTDSEAFDAVQEQAQHAVDRGKEFANDGVGYVKKKYRENPGAVVAVGAAAGIVLIAIVRRLFKR